MGYSNQRDEQQFTPKEKIVVAIFEEKGWIFRWDDLWDYHNNFSRGNVIEFKSPEMSEYITYNLDELEAEQLLHQEREAVIGDVAENKEWELNGIYRQKLREYIEKHPNTSLKKLNKLSVKDILYGV